MQVLAAPFILPISSAPIEDGVVIIQDGQIEAIGPREKILEKYPGSKVEEFPNQVLMPGLVNAHTHLDLLSCSGTGASPQFFDYLTNTWEHRKKLSPAERRRCLEEGIRELLQTGTSCVGDVGQYIGVIPQAANSAIRMALFPELLPELSGVGEKENLQESYESAFSQMEEIHAAKCSRITAGIAPYAAYTLSRNLLKIVSQQARVMKAPLKIHAAETFQEMQFFFESKGEIAEKLFPRMGWADQRPPEYRKTPLQYLESIGLLENAPTLVGGNHLSDSDIKALAKTGSKVVHSPRFNAFLKLGHPPLKKLLSAGVALALGTDGSAARQSLSLWDEMRFIQEHYPKTEQPTAEQLLRMATLDGAKALGLDRITGSLATGKAADLVAIKVSKKLTLKDLPEWLITHTTPREISAVFVEGKSIKM